MTAPVSPPAAPAYAPASMGRAALRWCASWWQIVHFGALAMSLALSPSSYSGPRRSAVVRHVYLGTAPILPVYTFLCALFSLVLIRIVVVTALNYGLTQYALQMVVRVLVLELIPLSAALFVALRTTIPGGADVVELRLASNRAQSTDLMRDELVPRVLGGMFAVVMLAALSCVISLLLAYLVVYGFSPWGFDAYTRMVGQVFSPAVTVIFGLKTLFFSLAVAIVPVASALYDAPAAPAVAQTSSQARDNIELRGLVRIFAVILLIETISLMGNYY